jgi:hypothetical protein
MTQSGSLQITYDDAIGMSLGTAAEAIFTWAMRKKTSLPDGRAQYPTLPTTLFVATPALCMAAAGMQNQDVGMNRFLASFLLGFGISTVVSFAVPVITGGERLDSEPTHHY